MNSSASDLWHSSSKPKIYPEWDYIDKRFDCIDLEASNPESTLILLLTSPRSGSTALCQSILNIYGIVAHEYFQHYGYLQTLASRWGCYENSFINKQKYVTSLVKMRSTQQFLILNLHGSHLKVFSEFLPYFQIKQIFCFNLVRPNCIKQAVSWHIASTTGQWSSVYNTAQEAITDSNWHAHYSYEQITKKLHMIQREQLNIYKFLRFHDLAFSEIVFKDENYASLKFLNSILPSNFVSKFSIKRHQWHQEHIPSLQNVKPQFSSINKLMIDKFLSDYSS